MRWQQLPYQVLFSPHSRLERFLEGGNKYYNDDDENEDDDVVGSVDTNVKDLDLAR